MKRLNHKENNQNNQRQGKLDCSRALTRITVVLGLTLLGIGLLTGSSSAFLIDHFDEWQQVSISGGGNTAWSTATGPNILGGERDLSVEVVTGTFFSTITVNQMNNSLLAMSQDPDVTGFGLITYDGPDGDALTLDPIGLGGFDMTDGGRYDMVRVLVDFIDLPTTICVDVYSDAFTMSRYALVFPGPVLSSTYFYFKFNDFVSVLGSGADFTNVGAVQIKFDGYTKATDVIIHSIVLVTTGVGDYVWLDENGDGIQDAGEPPVAGVLVTLYDNLHTAVASMTTGIDGGYGFYGLEPGDYYVTFTLPLGYTFTIPTAGMDSELDSDVDPGTGRTEAFTLAGGELDLSWDAGLEWAPTPTPTQTPIPTLTPTPTPSDFACVPRTLGYWKMQCRTGHHENPDPLFAAIAAQSLVFDELASASCRTVQTEVKAMRLKAIRHTLIVWLNLASGKISLDTPVDYAHLTSATTVGAAINEVEWLILTNQDVERAKDISDAVCNGWALACKGDNQSLTK